MAVGLFVTLNALIFCAAIAMTVMAWRAHYAVRRKQSLAFAGCFTLLSLGLLLQLLSAGIRPGLFAGEITNFLITGSLTLLSYLFLLAGFTLLLLVVEDVKAPSMWVLVFLLVIFSVFLAKNTFIITHALAAIITGLLALHYHQRYEQRRSLNNFLVYWGFTILVIGHATRIFSETLYYVELLSLIATLLGYFILFATAWRITRK